MTRIADDYDFIAKRMKEISGTAVQKEPTIWDDMSVGDALTVVRMYCEEELKKFQYVFTRNNIGNPMVFFMEFLQERVEYLKENGWPWSLDHSGQMIACDDSTADFYVQFLADGATESWTYTLRFA